MEDVARRRGMLRTLWERATRWGVELAAEAPPEPVIVRYCAPVCEAERLLAGVFHPDLYERAKDGGTPQAVIRIYRSPAPHPTDAPCLGGDREDLSYDLVTLAHECGHAMSYQRRGESWARYFASACKRDRGESLTAGDQALILEEERAAWEHGRSLLVAVGESDFTTFERLREAGLRQHAENMAGAK